MDKVKWMLWLKLSSFIGRVNNKKTRKDMKKAVLSSFVGPAFEVKVRGVKINQEEHTINVDVVLVPTRPHIHLTCKVEDK